MRHTILLIIALCLSPQLILGQTWQWAKQGGSTSVDRLNQICSDYLGNTYMIGQFGVTGLGTNYMVFDTDTVFNSGVNQIFLVKYSPGGSVLWAKSIGGNNPNSGNPLYEYGERVTFDSTTNSIIITGILVGSYNFGGTILSGSNDLFIAKLDSGGNFQWAKKISCSGCVNIASSALASDDQGYIYIGGGNNDTAYFGGIAVPPGGYLAKYDASGNCIWADRKFEGCVTMQMKALNDGLFVMGVMLNDTAVIDTFQYFSNISANLFLARYDTTGNLTWLKIPESASSIAGYGMDCDAMGNLYLISDFLGYIAFGNDSLFSPGTVDFCFARFDTNGNIIWMRQGNSSNSALGFQVATTQDGSVYIAGSYTGSIFVCNSTMNSNVNNSIFFIRYNGNGDCLGAGQLDATSYPPNTLRLTASGTGEFWIAGTFNTPMTIGTTQLTPTQNLASDVFLAKHDAITGLSGGERAANNKLIIYANPNSGKCNITVPDALLNERYLELRIFDNSGRLLQQKTLEMHDGTVKVNLEAEAKGVYQVTLGNGEKQYSGTIVFE